MTEFDCHACKLPIREKFVLKVKDRCWHIQCLTCTDCRLPLRDKCFMKADQIFCRDDFYRRYAMRCAGCSGRLPPAEVVRRAEQYVFHLECFSCAVCGLQLKTGDHFYLMSDDGKLVCKDDYLTINASNSGADADDGGKVFCGGGSKRPRTTISSQQLDALKRAYNDSSKPARQVRERLSAETGLDMRVVQVWFQNRRAKEKRLRKDVGRNYHHHRHHHRHQQQQQQQHRNIYPCVAVVDHDQPSAESDMEDYNSETSNENEVIITGCSQLRHQLHADCQCNDTVYYGKGATLSSRRISTEFYRYNHTSDIAGLPLSGHSRLGQSVNEFYVTLSSTSTPR